MFCFHGDVSNGSSTEAETQMEKKGNLPFLPSPLSVVLTLVTIRFHGNIRVFVHALAHTLLILVILIYMCLVFILFSKYFSRVLGSLFCIVASYAYCYLTVSVLFFFPVLVFVVQ